jgi:prevent-host-death family protein
MVSNLSCQRLSFGVHFICTLNEVDGGLPMEISVKEARQNFSSLLDKVAHGNEIVITRRGKRIAKLVTTAKKATLPQLKRFRGEIDLIGKPVSQAVIENRMDERY